jgi:ribosome assembly protein YihI (activator of Der GTPase)
MLFQTKLHGICEEVGQRLQNFMVLDSLNNRLSSPTLSVSSEAFVDLLDRLDHCMEYIGAHVSDTFRNNLIIQLTGTIYSKLPVIQYSKHPEFSCK